MSPPLPHILAVLGLLLTPSTAIRAEDTSARVAVEEAMRRANNYYQSHFTLGTAVWNRAAYHTGNMRVWEYLGVQAYHDHSVAWATANGWLRGPEGAAHADAHCCGQPYMDLYQIDPQPVRIANIKTTMDALVANPAASTDDWTWIDAFYMAAPTLARLDVLYPAGTGGRTYYQQLSDMYFHTKNTLAGGLWSAPDSLWYRDADKKNNNRPFWGRGNGWVIGMCARLLEQYPDPADPRRDEFETMLQTMAAKLITLQQPDGFWRSDLLNPNAFPNPETSSTAFFTYGITYGINHGLLDAPTYRPVIEKAWNAMVSTALHADGKLGYVQGIAAAPGAATYDSERDYGYGIFMLAGCEYLELLGGVPPVYPNAGSPQSVTDTDRNMIEPVTLDAGGSTLRSGGITRYSWWQGSTYLGDGVQLTVNFPHGSHTVTLKVETTTGETLATSTLITVSTNSPTVSAIGYQTGNPPSNTLDGSLSTRWSQEGLGQWILFTLPAITLIDHMGIAFYNGNQRSSKFDLQLSTDGQIWNTVFSGQSSGTSLALENFSFPMQPVRYVRYVGNGTNISGFNWNSVTEVAIPMFDPTADSDGNGLPAAWEVRHFDTQGLDPESDPNADGITLAEDYLLGNNPNIHNPPLFEITPVVGGNLRLVLLARAAFGPGYVGKNRRFAVQSNDSLDPSGWRPITGWENIAGDNLNHELLVTHEGARRFYRIAVRLE